MNLEVVSMSERSYLSSTHPVIAETNVIDKRPFTKVCLFICFILLLLYIVVEVFCKSLKNAYKVIKKTSKIKIIVIKKPINYVI